MSSFNIFKDVVDKDLCIGCGACTAHNASQNLKMDWNSLGFLIPKQEVPTVITDYNLIKVCPFNPSPEKEVETENELANLFLKDAPLHHPKIGKYFNTYVGYSPEFRLTSSSGGLASYITKELLNRRIADRVYSVRETTAGKNHFEYGAITSSECVSDFSQTKYYPVTMADFFKDLSSSNKKVAVVGIACFIKAIRLYQYYHPEVKDKIVFLIGIICGGMKSRFFSEYLSAKTGITNNTFSHPQFRIKNFKSTASDYTYGCIDHNGKFRSIKMQLVGDMWGTGMFKNNACDFCDDVTTELADISLGDAWLDPYNKDGRGTNVIVTRSRMAEDLIKEGITSKKISIEYLPLATFLFSQQGSFNHRHKALGYRIKKAKQQGARISTKRHDNEKLSWDFKLVQKKRMIIRKQSLLLWKKTKSIDCFEREMKKYLYRLRWATRIYHYLRTIKTRLKR